jgi:hypothetical protein
MTDTLFLVLEFLVFIFALAGIVWLAEVFKDPRR